MLPDTTTAALVNAPGLPVILHLISPLLVLGGPTAYGNCSVARVRNAIWNSTLPGIVLKIWKGFHPELVRNSKGPPPMNAQ